MTFVVTLIALLIERFFDWSHIRNWNWFVQLQRYITQRLQGKHPGLILAASVLPVALIAALIAYIFHGMLYGVIGLVFDLAILLYCLGPNNLWAEVVTNKVTGVKNIFVAANRRILAVIFWYLFTGVLGAVIYRTLAVAAQSAEPEDVRQYAENSEAILDWLPVRFFALLFAAGPAYKKVLDCWRKNLPTGISNNETTIAECGVAALNMDTVSTANSATLKAAISVIDRTLIILLVLVAIVILMSY